MQSLWNDTEAAQFTDDLAQRVYTSRLLGSDPALVMHGGGNTSVKSTRTNIFEETEDVLSVKGSGWDLATITAAGFAPVQLPYLLRLAQLEQLSDTAMARELRTATLDPAAPAPSVEAILHALLPYKFVDHTHADAVVTLTNTPHGLEYAREVYGDAVVYIPYIMPGFELARYCAEVFPQQASQQTIGMLLMNHGMFSFGDTARTAYERMLDLVSRAEAFLQQRGAWHVAWATAADAAPDRPLRTEIATLRRAVADVAGFPLLLRSHRDTQGLGFAQLADVGMLAGQGPLTPDHIIRTKRVPMIGRDVQAYAEAYTRYFETHAPLVAQPLTMLDAAPRVVLDPELGLCTLGRRASEVAIVADIYRHTIDSIMRATRLERWQALPQADLFRVEYWDLEQAKLKRQGSPPPFAGEVALVTGAASGIGKACAAALLAQGAAVVGLDIDPAIQACFSQPDWLGIVGDVTDAAAIEAALETAVQHFGGLDILILNAGIFPHSQRIAELDLATWQRVQQVNLEANVVLLREAYPLLKLALRGGRVVVIGTRNVPAPGVGAAAYSASKAALTQLARIAALEWGRDNIRVNMLHPDAVFDTGIWSDAVLESRAASYGISVAEYKRRNVLQTEVTSAEVGALAAALCSPLFARTTGAQIPIDGGNERVI